MFSECKLANGNDSFILSLIEYICAMKMWHFVHTDIKKDSKSHNHDDVNDNNNNINKNDGVAINEVNAQNGASHSTHTLYESCVTSRANDAIQRFHDFWYILLLSYDKR